MVFLVSNQVNFAENMTNEDKLFVSPLFFVRLVALATDFSGVFSINRKTPYDVNLRCCSLLNSHFFMFFF